MLSSVCEGSLGVADYKSSNLIKIINWILAIKLINRYTVSQSLITTKLMKGQLMLGQLMLGKCDKL